MCGDQPGYGAECAPQGQRSGQSGALDGYPRSLPGSPVATGRASVAHPEVRITVVKIVYTAKKAGTNPNVGNQGVAGWSEGGREEVFVEGEGDPVDDGLHRVRRFSGRRRAVSRAVHVGQGSGGCGDRLCVDLFVCRRHPRCCPTHRGQAWSEIVTAWLAELRHCVYAGWGVAQLAAALKLLGSETIQTSRRVDGRIVNRRCIRIFGGLAARPDR